MMGINPYDLSQVGKMRKRPKTFSRALTKDPYSTIGTIVEISCRRREVNLNSMMDEEIQAFLKREKEETDSFLKAFAEKNPSLCLEMEAYKMWFAGLKKYGKKWSDREYQLREK